MTDSKPPIGPPPMPINTSAQPFWEHPIVVILSLIGFFPIGLWIIWQAKWATNRKVKWVLGFAIFLLIVYAVSPNEFPTRELQEADRQWDSEQRFEAVQKYKSLLKAAKPGDHPPGTQWIEDTIIRGRLYRRIIEHETEYGDPGEARDWIREARHEDINDLMFESQRATEMWNRAAGR